MSDGSCSSARSTVVGIGGLQQPKDGTTVRRQPDRVERWACRGLEDHCLRRVPREPILEGIAQAFSVAGLQSIGQAAHIGLPDQRVGLPWLALDVDHARRGGHIPGEGPHRRVRGIGADECHPVADRGLRGGHQREGSTDARSHHPAACRVDVRLLDQRSIGTRRVRRCRQDRGGGRACRATSEAVPRSRNARQLRRTWRGGGGRCPREPRRGSRRGRDGGRARPGDRDQPRPARSGSGT